MVPHTHTPTTNFLTPRPPLEPYNWMQFCQYLSWNAIPQNGLNKTTLFSDVILSKLKAPMTLYFSFIIHRS